MGQKCEGTCVHVNSQQRVTSANEDFDTQVHEMIGSVDTSQPVSPAALVIAQGAY